MQLLKEIWNFDVSRRRANNGRRELLFYSSCLHVLLFYVLLFSNSFLYKIVKMYAQMDQRKKPMHINRRCRNKWIPLLKMHKKQSTELWQNETIRRYIISLIRKWSNWRHGKNEWHNARSFTICRNNFCRRQTNPMTSCCVSRWAAINNESETNHGTFERCRRRTD